MYRWMRRFGSPVAVWSLGCGPLIAQGVVPPAPAAAPIAARKIEPGLEEAVNWKWRVIPPEGKEWGRPLPAAPAPPPAAGGPGAEGNPAPPPPAEKRPWRYEVQKGDALIKIARKFGMTPAQLKQFNELKSDRIVVGQILDIPTPKELLVMEPPPPPPAPDPPKEKGGKGKKKPKSGDAAGEKPAAGGLDQEPTTPEQLERETVLLQVFLDREMFSAGAIDAKRGPMYQKVTQLYLETHADIIDLASLKAKALATVKQPYANYVLRPEDFRFIQPRDPAPVAKEAGKSPPAKARKKGEAPALPALPPPTYAELVKADFLGYASAWEFVAERFHCDEAFLRHLNPHLEAKPAAGAAFQVPNVIPFEVEKALEPPLQPVADPVQSITAAVAPDLSLLKISRQGQLIAVMPLASARPGLRGRGVWTVLDAIPAPRLGTRHEPREGPPPAAEPAATPEELLPAGPNNPVGVLWLNLAKARSKEPLAYGLHGTSIPGQMKSCEGIGGLRLANWDIARAVRLMPAGTPLQW